MRQLIRFLKDEDGATAIEYGLIAALIAVAVAGTFPTMSDWVNTVVMTTAEAMS